MNFPDIAMRLVKSLATAKFNEVRASFAAALAPSSSGSRPPHGVVSRCLPAFRLPDVCEQTVDLALQLSVDPRKPGQNVRGMAMLPFGTGKKEVVAVFAKGEKAEEARRAGADLVGAEDLVERIQKGELSFTKAIATPDVMPLVGRVARILGPRGLMPNPKLGTVTADVAGAIGAARRGQVEFKVEKKGILHAPIGKVSFSEEQLMENLRSLMLAVNDARPETVKGVFMKHAFVSSTMGRSVAIDIATLDPSKPRFMQTADMAKTAAAAAASAGGRA